MFVIRPIAESDLDTFIQLAFEAGLGIMSMPKNPSTLHELIKRSVSSFAKTIEKPHDEFYLFVLENLQDHTLGGVCGIRAKTGISSPLVFFRIEHIAHYNPVLEQNVETPFLKLVHYQEAPTEICSLFLAHASRHSGLGRLLSLSRLLFIAEFSKRFDRMVFADMRGIVENNHDCPFWDGICKHFVNLDYASFMQVKQTHDIQIHEMLPDTPIFISLLPQEVQQSIGKVHTNTKPALNMLMQEGFTISDDVSIYDGGPKIEVETQEIHTVKESVTAIIQSITSNIEDTSEFLIANRNMHFRCCYGNVLFDEEKKVSISVRTAAALKVDIGDQIRFISHARLHP